MAHAGGRPTKYDKAKHPDLVQAYASTTKTDAEIAANLGISYASMRTWLKTHPEFLAAHKAGRAELLDTGEMSLYKRMTGYEYDENTVTVEEMVSAKPGSKQYDALMNALDARKPGEFVYAVKRSRTRKHVQPDVGAAALVLINRRPRGYDPDDPSSGWQHVQRVEHTGANGGPITLAQLMQDAGK